MKGMVRQRMTEWRASGTVERISTPTKLSRARALGYKAKPGFVVVRVKVNRGNIHKPKILGGRRPRRYGYNKLTHGKSEKWIAEERAQRRYPNLVLLNSYYLAEDGKHKFYEVMFVDPEHPSIAKDKNLNWTADKAQKGRVFRGLSTAGKKSRGLATKGKGTVKSRPSIRAKGRLRRH
ncbi:MAG: 50S ribosomal protein L15e [Candidatus Thermoplasmatota archaeon]|jgi:large subunit ribosomal protein L15e|nr:50S ribosomal protein L15e [Candidatus Thermoplasmatota archaeon]